jgi:hypothetical protein
MRPGENIDAVEIADGVVCNHGVDADGYCGECHAEAAAYGHTVFTKRVCEHGIYAGDYCRACGKDAEPYE